MKFFCANGKDPRNWDKPAGSMKSEKIPSDGILNKTLFKYQTQPRTLSSAVRTLPSASSGESGIYLTPRITT